MTKVDTQTRTPKQFPIDVTIRTHTVIADASVAAGGEDTAPGAHDWFDAALATCKSHTALWYARKKSYPLERVITHLESDNSREREGFYALHVRVELIGSLDDNQRADIMRAIEKCPVAKLMTTTEVTITQELTSSP
ncbi:MAG: OsmC family protein [Kofleriaceae bacterium]